MFKLALCQIKGSFDKKESMATVTRYVETAAENGAQVISLPEMWNCPYSNDYFREYAEAEDGPTVKFLSDLAAKNDIYLIGGSIPELDGGKVYNTSFSFDRSGQIIGKHRKVHLFDIDVKGGIRFMESDTLTAGKDMTILDTEFGKIGVAICYDVRFPEWFRKMALAGAKLIVLPAAFNMTTGPAHWELSFRARALDNQIYMVGCAPMRDVAADYKSWGHSIITDPWGTVIGMLDEKEGVLTAELDLDYEAQVREELPLLKSRRNDMYRLEKII